jgi:hypothetical protein
VLVDFGARPIVYARIDFHDRLHHQTPCKHASLHLRQEGWYILLGFKPFFSMVSQSNCLCIRWDILSSRTVNCPRDSVCPTADLKHGSRQGRWPLTGKMDLSRKSCKAMNATACDCAGGFNTRDRHSTGRQFGKLRHGATLEGDERCAPNFHEHYPL